MEDNAETKILGLKLIQRTRNRLVRLIYLPAGRWRLFGCII